MSIRDGCVVLDRGGELSLAAFFADAVIARDESSGRTFVKLGDGPEVTLGVASAGSQGHVEDPAARRVLSNWDTCAQATGISATSLIYTVDPGADLPSAQR